MIVLMILNLNPRDTHKGKKGNSLFKINKTNFFISHSVVLDLTH